VVEDDANVVKVTASWEASIPPGRIIISVEAASVPAKA
jgi:hypothetical protein